MPEVKSLPFKFQRNFVCKFLIKQVGAIFMLRVTMLPLAGWNIRPRNLMKEKETQRANRIS